MSERNPFEILRLDPTASEAEIIQQAGRLRQRVTDDNELTLIRQAVQELTSSKEKRQLWALLTPPNPCHDLSAIDQLANAHRRAVETGTDAEVKPFPDLDMDELTALLRPILIRELQMEKEPLEMPPIDETLEEIDHQTVEGLWQELPFSPEL